MGNNDNPFEMCTQCDDEGWFFYQNNRTKRVEIRHCEKCERFASDDKAADYALSKIKNSLELVQRITQVRESDEDIKRATAHVFGDKVPTLMLPATLPLRLELPVRLELYNLAVKKELQHPAMLIVQYIKDGLARDKTEA